VPTVAAYDGFWNPYRRVLLASLFLSISFVFVSSVLLPSLLPPTLFSFLLGMG